MSEESSSDVLPKDGGIFYGRKAVNALLSRQLSRGAAAEEEAGDEVHEGGVRGFSIGIGMGMFWNVPEERKREVECSSV